MLFPWKLMLKTPPPPQKTGCDRHSWNRKKSCFLSLSLGYTFLKTKRDVQTVGFDDYIPFLFGGPSKRMPKFQGKKLVGSFWLGSVTLLEIEIALVFLKEKATKKPCSFQSSSPLTGTEGWNLSHGTQWGEVIFSLCTTIQGYSIYLGLAIVFRIVTIHQTYYKIF